jgi:LPXTG-motif cell wall-anchored protein
MKKLIGIMVMFVVLASSAFAIAEEATPWYIRVTPASVDLANEECKDVTVEVNALITLPAALYYDDKCKEISGFSFMCDANDPSVGDELSITGPSATNSEGFATITVCNNGLETGNYHYTVCAQNVCKEATFSATGDVSVPEFTTIGAALALAGAAGIYLVRKRK